MNGKMERGVCMKKGRRGGMNEEREGGGIPVVLSPMTAFPADPSCRLTAWDSCFGGSVEPTRREGGGGGHGGNT